MAFFVRAIVFEIYLQHDQRYCQSDSSDYHNCALCLLHGFGMHRPDGRPIFWRTPGYPWYLNLFYGIEEKYIQSGQFDLYEIAHKRALWVQIILSSFLPLFVYLLALILTRSYIIAWLTALISVIHIGFVLASTYLLTDSIATLLFLLFLIFFYQSFSLIGEPIQQRYSSTILLPLSALFLALYTWMRPMGLFIGLFASGMLLCGHEQWRTKLSKILLFLTLFITLLFPWFYRNHQLTGKWFFCPLFGLYFNVFNAPKILSRIADIPLADAHKKLTYDAAILTGKEIESYRRMGKKEIVCGEMVCLRTAWPLIMTHPFYFMYDWIVEVCKTTFDLYAYQLVALYNNCFKWDPLIEYLPEKIQECLYRKPLPWFSRVLAFIELFFNLLLWVGIFAGAWKFVVLAWWRRDYSNLSLSALWLKAGLMIIAVVAQTGGFGYARLRLPIEALILILGLSFYFLRK